MPLEIDGPGTLFCLVPYKNNRYATEIVQDHANRYRRCVDPYIAPGPFLRIGLDQPLKNQPHLARFGQRECNDVILNNRFSRADQCYFDFNEDTGELLLHDISPDGSTELYAIDEKGRPDHPQIWKTRTPRQCVVMLAPDPYPDPENKRGRQWIFKIRDAMFSLITRSTPGDQGEAVFTGERRAFASQPDPERTHEGAIQQLNLGLQSPQSDAITATYKASPKVTYNSYNTRFKTPLEPEEDEVIRYTKLGRLGKGGQGEVHKVVDMYNGNHHACKIIAVKAIPEWIYSETDFRAKVQMEVNLVKQIEHHDNIVPYILYTQGFRIGENIEIFMPLYDGNLYQLIERYRNERKEVVRAMTDRMLYQILDALDFVHTYNPQIIHQNIKPANILYQGDKFLLTDFGIAKVVDPSKTMAGSRWYVAPEVRQNGEQTPKVDIYGLGITFVECLVKLPSEVERDVTWHHWEQWHRHLQTILNQHERRIAAMLADVADQRPTARQLLRDFFSHTSLQNVQTNTASSSSRVSSALTNQVTGTAMIYSAEPLPWI